MKKIHRLEPSAEFLRVAKLAAAFHEAGHAVAALHHGVPARLQLTDRPGADAGLERPWIATCESLYWMTGVKRTRTLAAIIGVAGAVASQIHAMGRWEEYDEMWREEISPTDRLSIGTHSIVGAARVADQILTERWKAVEALAKALFKDGYLPDGIVGTIYAKATR